MICTSGRQLNAPITSGPLVARRRLGRAWAPLQFPKAAKQLHESSSHPPRCNFGRHSDLTWTGQFGFENLGVRFARRRAKWLRSPALSPIPTESRPRRIWSAAGPPPPPIDRLATFEVGRLRNSLADNNASAQWAKRQPASGHNRRPVTMKLVSVRRRRPGETAARLTEHLLALQCGHLS